MGHRAYISRITLVDIEGGEPGIAAGRQAPVLSVLGRIDELRELAEARSKRSVLGLKGALSVAYFNPPKAQKDGHPDSEATDCARKLVNVETVSFEQLAGSNSHQTATTFCLEKESSWPNVKTATKRAQWVQWLFKSAYKSAEALSGRSGGCWFSTFLLFGAIGCKSFAARICCSE